MKNIISNRTFKWLAIVSFVAVVFLLLFFFVERKSKEKHSNNDVVTETDSIKLDNSAKDEKIVYIELPPKIEYKDTTIYKERIVYRDTIIYKELPPKIEYRDKIVYQDKIIYQDRPEPYHRFGKGKAKLLIYTNCPNGYIKVWVDGDYWGQLTCHYLSSPPVDCDVTNCTLSQIVLSGKHHIIAENSSTKGKWDFYITINEDSCIKQELTCK
jgi:hypothetical protein